MSIDLVCASKSLALAVMMSSVGLFSLPTSMFSNL
jgi:hypothetical protein